MRVHIVNVGDGDAIFVRCPEGKHEMLIDAGDSTDPGGVQRFKAFLSSIQPPENMIERVITTHPDANHIGNMSWVLRTFRIGLYIDNGYAVDAKLFRNIGNILAERRIPHGSTLIDGRPPDVDFCPLRDVTIRVLSPYGFDLHSAKAGARTIVLRLDYRNTAFLFLGNADEEEGKMLMEDPATAPLLNCFFLKTDGSGAASNARLLDLINPRYVVASCAEQDPGSEAGHRRPQYSVVQNLLRHAWPREGPVTSCSAWDDKTSRWRTVVLRQALYNTTVDKYVVFETDGENIHKVATTAK
jgi:beta-lactamase superfamily II metal-dependent hydrolase